VTIPPICESCNDQIDAGEANLCYVCAATLLHRAEDAEARVAELGAANVRLLQDRMDYSSVKTIEGLNASEWIWRTGKAERQRDQAIELLGTMLRYADYGTTPTEDDNVVIESRALLASLKR